VLSHDFFADVPGLHHTSAGRALMLLWDTIPFTGMTIGHTGVLEHE
jgi:hypothetical protein